MCKTIFFLCIVLVQTAVAQVGTWKSYTDMKNIRRLQATPSGIIAATSGGVFEYDRPADSYKRYTNVDGLSSIDVTTIARDQNGFIFTGASNGMIDVYDPSTGWYSVPDIFRAQDKSQKGINCIRLWNARLYIGTDFGVTVYDPVAREFADTYTKFGVIPALTRVNDIYFFDNKIWVATDKGIASADMLNPNLQDPARWVAYQEFSGSPIQNVKALGEMSGKLLAGENGGFLLLDGTQWRRTLTGMTVAPVLRIVQGKGFLLGIVAQSVYRIYSETNADLLGERVNGSGYPSGIFISDAAILSDTSIVISSNIGFSIYEPDKPWTFRKPNGPNSNQFLSMTVDQDGLLWSGARAAGAYSFDGTIWNNYAPGAEYPFPSIAVQSTASDLLGSMWFTTWGDGVIRRTREGKTAVFNGKNVPGFPGIPDNDSFFPVSAVEGDSRGNMWFLHYQNRNGNILSCLTANGDWKFFQSPKLAAGTLTSTMAIDQFGRKWLTIGADGNRGLLVFNDAGTLDDVRDDTWEIIEVSDKNGLNAGLVKDVAVDNFGDIWIGTDLGLRTIFSSSDFQHIARTCYNTRCNIEGENIQCIAVDPVNNKWLGTKSGVFILSSDGSAILEHYSVDNSPLLDNDVTSIIVHPVTGTAYIGTISGLSSVETPFMKPQDAFSSLKIVPNPFSPGTDGQLSIDGLVENAFIKIITPSGNLVAEIITPGGRIGFWDGKTTRGDYAPSGVYIIVAYAADGTQVALAKLAIIRK